MDNLKHVTSEIPSIPLQKQFARTDMTGVGCGYIPSQLLHVYHGDQYG